MIEKSTGNPLMDSYNQIITLEFKSEILRCYELVQKDHKDDFDSFMAEIVSEIVSAQRSADVSFISAGLLMTLPDEADKDTDTSPEEWDRFVIIVKAAICWGILKGFHK